MADRALSRPPDGHPPQAPRPSVGGNCHDWALRTRPHDHHRMRTTGVLRRTAPQRSLGSGQPRICRGRNPCRLGITARSRPSSIQQPRLLRFKLPNIHAHEHAAERAQVPALGRLLAIEERIQSEPCTSLNFRDRDQRAAPVTPPHHDDSDNRVPAPQDGRNHPPVLARRKRFMLLGGDNLAHRRLGPLPCFPSSSAMTARTPNTSWAARASSTPASAWLLERPKPAEAAWPPNRFGVLLPTLTVASPPIAEEKAAPLPRWIRRGGQPRRRTPLPAEVCPAAAVVLVGLLRHG